MPLPPPPWRSSSRKLLLTIVSATASDRIANTERHLDLAKAHNDRAVDETKELEALNRSIFRPTCESPITLHGLREERALPAK